MFNCCILVAGVLSSGCIFAAETLYFKNEQSDPSHVVKEERTRDFTAKEPKIEDRATEMRQQRSFFNKLGFLSGYKIGSSFPSQSSGQLIATHSGNFFGKFMNANIRLVYGSQPVISGVIPTVTSVAGPLKGSDTNTPDVGSEKVTPGFILITTRRAPVRNGTKDDKNDTDENMSVIESILIPVFERAGALKFPEVIARNQSIISTTEKNSKDTSANRTFPSHSNETSTIKEVFIV